ncbi:MAG: patatin-like phospholipase family protein [Thermodesulfovibrionales bacterium]|nr:patatin-like phospholipase family protein [Thermodesulfovibrionales bacterium]
MTQKLHTILITFLLFIFGLFCIFPPDYATAAETKERPKIGLVLGGGGAKGAAHIGVLKVIEELKIPVACIAGTSMGAIVASLYASGMSAAEIEKVLTTVDWDDIFSDNPPRKDIGFRRKQEDLTYLSKISVGIKNDKVQMPKSLIAGQKIGIFFETLLLPVSQIEDFDQLPIPFRAVAADLETGEMVLLGSGSLAAASRASMSALGVFPPAEVNGRYLTDGGIVRNLPVDVVREMCAEVVIAVDVGKPLSKREDLGSPIAVMNQMIDIMINQNVQAQIDTLGDKDVFIRPELGSITSVDFQRGKEAVDQGEQAARLKEKELRRYSVTDEAYAVFAAKHHREKVSIITAGSVTVEGLSVVSPEAVASKLKISQGDSLDIQKLKEDVGLLYGMGDFERIDLQFKPNGDKYDIILRPKEKSWGPNYLRMGINLESDFDGDNNYNIGVDYTMRWMNRLGAEWKNQLQFGSAKGIFSEFYQPIVPSRLFFVAPHGTWMQDNVNVYHENNIIAEYRLRTLEGGIDFGIQPWTYGEVRIGYLGGFIKPKLMKGTLGIGEGRINQGALTLKVVADQIDNVNFPHEGYFGYVKLYSSLRDVGADNNYNKIEVSFLKAFTYKKYTILGSILLGSYIGNQIPYYDEFSMGGFFALSGLHEGQLRGQRLGLGRLITYWNAHQSLLGNFYLGGSVETGNVWQKDEETEFKNMRLSGSVFIGYDTPFGPFYLGFGHAGGGNSAVYFYLGQTFGRQGGSL